MKSKLTKVLAVSLTALGLASLPGFASASDDDRKHRGLFNAKEFHGEHARGHKGNYKRHDNNRYKRKNPHGYFNAYQHSRPYYSPRHHRPHYRYDYGHRDYGYYPHHTIAPVISIDLH